MASKEDVRKFLVAADKEVRRLSAGPDGDKRAAEYITMLRKRHDELKEGNRRDPKPAFSRAKPAVVHDAVMDLPQEVLADVVPFPAADTYEAPSIVQVDVLDSMWDVRESNVGPVDDRFPMPNRTDPV